MSLKDKGRRYEHKTADILNDVDGIEAVRVFASGAYGNFNEALVGDVQMKTPKGNFIVESKFRKDIPKWIKNANEQGDIVFLWTPRTEPKVLMNVNVLLRLLTM
jgi:Holliday junction resolvase